MAYHSLNRHFAAFFRRLNPSTSFGEVAAREHANITALIEDPNGAARALSPRCFLQGSYKQQTAIYTINDVDVIALCRLWHPGAGGGSGGASWTRDRIFATVAAPLLADSRYKAKVRYDAGSMCIKVDLSIKIEILPVVYRAGNNDPSSEPFRLYRPESGQWEDGYARYHQRHLSAKNDSTRTDGNFIPAIKVFKHLRSRFGLDAVSFHIECLLYQLPDRLFLGVPADYVPVLLNHIAATPAGTWYGWDVRTACGERDIFTANEWTQARWEAFHKAVILWARAATAANSASDQATAVEYWQLLLGETFFPKEVGP